ncbi:hypothetical protein VAA049_2684 [Vibrio cholerae]|nr:hypothetical protein VAA049_2684 [Vibrio cholerae]GIA34842.1 endonuclease [Vibrio cholerae]GIB92589.1 endonuclease [Vibrio cholerae]
MCESSLERDCCYHLEYSKDVISFQSQPEGFYYSSGNKRCPYTPDFLVRNQDGSEYYLEVKPLAKTFSDDFKGSFALKRIAAQHQGKSLVLVTDKQIRNGVYLENLNLIHRYSGLVDFSLPSTKIVEELSVAGRMCIGALADNLKLSIGEVIAAVFCLIGLGRVNVPLDSAINEMSVISVN